jgi:PPP family 3-phenylpropionic acid transporter
MSEVQGLSSADIGLVLGMTQVARTVWSPAIGLVADSLKAPKQMAVLLALACVLANVSLLMSHKIVTLLVLCSITNCLFGAIMPLGESLAVTKLRVGDYGRVRLWGSVGFIAANVLGGQVIHATGAHWVMPIMVLYSILLAAACMFLPSDPKKTAQQVPTTADSAQSQATEKSAPPKRSAWTEAVALASNAKYIIFLLAVALIQASHATYYSFGTIMLQQAGHSGSVIGLLWGVGVAAEV